MIHTWTENIEVFPRSASIVEDNGIFLSNYVCMQPVKKSPDVPDGNVKGRVTELPGSQQFPLHPLPHISILVRERSSREKVQARNWLPVQ